ncbi:hypothetical protein U9M48_005590 [Paspalum notatum var. saurae]|uniref:Uncharacterized protein n=1 Tax=Paspalum notatum var. saurae TaxID=547442 RepID=A0AAQ3PX69_PASNO
MPSPFAIVLVAGLLLAAPMAVGAAGDPRDEEEPPQFRARHRHHLHPPSSRILPPSPPAARDSEPSNCNGTFGPPDGTELLDVPQCEDIPTPPHPHAGGGW